MAARIDEATAQRIREELLTIRSFRRIADKLGISRRVVALVANRNQHGLAKPKRCPTCGGLVNIWPCLACRIAGRMP